jgi:AraC-like DNA-binding protein
VSAAVRHLTEREYWRVADDVRTFLRLNYDKDVHLGDFCLQSHYSRRSVQRALKHCGLRWSDLLTEARLDQSARLLRETDLPVKAVVFQVGYKHRSYFADRFHKRFGTTPTRYREVNNGDRPQSA